MTQRERILGIALGAILVVLGGSAVVQRYIVQPVRQLKEDIAREQETREKLEHDLTPALAAKQLWQRRTAHTLPYEPDSSALVFRSDVNKLLTRSGLTQGLIITPKPIKRASKGSQAGFVEVAIGITVEGKLRELVDFLRSFYQRPYVKRVDSLVINAPPTEVKPRTGPSPDPTLKFNMTVSTLLLPDLPGIASKPLDPARLDDPELLDDKSFKPYLAENPTVFNTIFSSNLFKLWAPPKPPPKPPVAKRDEPPRTTHTPPPPPPPPARADADQFRLLGTTSLNGELIAYIEDARNVVEPPREAHLNEQVDDGQLVLIEPDGIVVRTHARAGRAREYVYWFYALGATFDQRQRLTPAKYPQVYDRLQEILRLSEAKRVMQSHQQPASTSAPSTES